MMLDQQIVERIRQGWRAELRAPAAFRGLPPARRPGCGTSKVVTWTPI
jgi:hypothetical protein